MSHRRDLARALRGPFQTLCGVLALSAALVTVPGLAAPPTNAEAVARVEEALGAPLAAAASADVADAIADVVGRLPPEEIQYSIDIVGAVAKASDPGVVAAAVEAARSAVADAAAANPGIIEDWWAELIDESIVMVADAARGPEVGGGADAPAAPSPAPGDADGDVTAIDPAIARPELNIGDGGLPLLADDLALSTDFLTGSAGAPDTTAEARQGAPPPMQEAPAPSRSAEAPTASLTSDGADVGSSERRASTETGTPSEPRPRPGEAEGTVAQSVVTAAGTDAADDAASAGQMAADDDAARLSTASDDAADETVADDTVIAALPLLPDAASGVDAVIGRMPGGAGEPTSGPGLPSLPTPPAADIATPTPGVPLQVDQKLRSFDGIVELVEFWLQKPVPEASTIELARAVQATVLMLPPDNLSSASSVAGAIAAVVPDPRTVRAVTRAAEAGVQVKVSRDPELYDPGTVEATLVAIGRATGNLAALQPAAGGFVPNPEGVFDGAPDAFGAQAIDPGS